MRANRYIGSSVERLEDRRFLRGKGTYVGDLPRPRLLYAAILRSSQAHGCIRSIDTAAALAQPGVHHVITAAEIGRPVPRIPIRLQPLPNLIPYHQPVIAETKVRYVGEPIAVVLADSTAIEVVAIAQDQARIARLTYRCFGKGRHPAGVNSGGCLAYVLAKTPRLPLFYQRVDFRQTEITGVSLPRASI